MSRDKVILIAGCVSDPDFHRCCMLAKVLENEGIAVDFELDMYETQFDEYLAKKKTRLGGNIFEVQ